MNPPNWDESRRTWFTQVQSNLLGSIEVLITTDGPSSPPTARQLATIDVLGAMPPASIANLSDQARVSRRIPSPDCGRGRRICNAYSTTSGDKRTSNEAVLRNAWAKLFMLKKLALQLT